MGDYSGEIRFDHVIWLVVKFLVVFEFGRILETLTRELKLLESSILVQPAFIELSFYCVGSGLLAADKFFNMPSLWACSLVYFFGSFSASIFLH